MSAPSKEVKDLSLKESIVLFVMQSSYNWQSKKCFKDSLLIQPLVSPKNNLAVQPGHLKLSGKTNNNLR